MNQSISLFSLFSLIFHLFLIVILYGAIVNGDIIGDLCKNVSTDDPQLSYSFCVSSLEANPLSKTSDIFGLAVISMELCSNNASYIQTYIDSILKDGKVEPEARGCLGDCKEFYSMAFSDVQTSMTAFSAKDYGTALIYLSSAMATAGTCKDGFTDAGIDFGPLNKQYNDFFLLHIISLGIVSKIEHP
ncbi:hypothetical protein MKW94_003129 [Papaver nudicaule]|uniref:Pectinesterase inhibitor domain-containing protein n=1 Tax=Papaver nudicaule TaxID=74823 RepID=A0AA41V456_PAPNU|nr:hypothetical protein [Papaver nudicaule]